MKVQLQLVEGPDSNRVLEFSGYQSFVLGRDRPKGGSQPGIGDPYLSRHHIRLTLTPPVITALDLGSRNGFFVNGFRRREGRLRDGDTLKVGHTSMRIRLASAKDLAEVTPEYVLVEPCGRTNIENFELLGKVRGDALQMHHARDCRSYRPATLHLVRTASQDDASVIGFVLEGLNLVTTLDSPGLVRVRSAGLEGEWLWIATDLAHDPTLKEHVTRYGPLSLDQVADVGKQLLSGIAHCHARGVVLGVLDPGSVLIRFRNGAPTIRIDRPGVHRTLLWPGVPCMAAAAQLQPAPHFLSPEQILDARSMDRRSDLYGAGAVLCFAATGQPPFAGDDTEACVSVLRGDAPAPAGEPGTGLAAAISRALMSSPEARFGSAKDMGAALSAS